MTLGLNIDSYFDRMYFMERLLPYLAIPLLAVTARPLLSKL